MYGFSALFKPLAEELGFSRAVTSVATGIGRFSGGFEAPVTGWLTDKFGPKWVILFGVTVFGIGLILMNFIDSLWAFYLVWGFVVGTGMNTSLAFPIDKAITNWFVKKRGFALSVRWVFSGILVLPLIAWLINIQGWRMACVTGGLVMLCVGLPLTWFLIRNRRPEYYGLFPDGIRPDRELEEDAEKTIEKGVRYAAEVHEIEFTLRQAMKTPAYWLLVLAQIGTGTAVLSLSMHVIPFLTDIGMETTNAATTLTIAGLFSVAARFGIGVMVDRFNKESLRFIYGGALLLQAVGIAVFLVNQTIAMVYPFLILWYIGNGGAIVMMSIIGGRYFGRKAYGSIRGSSIIFSMPFGIIGPIFTGWIYDTKGDYITAFITLAALLSVAGFVTLLNRPPKPPAKVTDIREFL